MEINSEMELCDDSLTMKIRRKRKLKHPKSCIIDVD